MSFVVKIRVIFYFYGWGTSSPSGVTIKEAEVCVLVVRNSRLKLHYTGFPSKFRKVNHGTNYNASINNPPWVHGNS